ncbi:MAG: dienelactone hydrolase family protein [Sporomusaceae bacterium]|nr:dienelactone hydrolase family protein [Sporomusaceae bacterium]
MKSHNHNTEDTIIVVLHEVYGVNKHIIDVCEKLQSYGVDTIAPNLLNGREAYAAEEEQAAYNYFMSSIGFEEAFKEVNRVLISVRPYYKNVYVLGYSIGATLAWLAAQTGLCDFCIAFYGSRIRDYLRVQPKCDMVLFFPEIEKSFVVDDLLVCLRTIKNVQAEKLAGQHGFANPFSKSYHKESADKAWARIEQILADLVAEK